MKKKILLITILLFAYSSSQAQDRGLRKYPHVKQFYKEISSDAIAVSKKYHLPAAAVLAIAGLESGYGSGYVAQITGNILSLGAFKGDAELPALYLPYSKKEKKILFDPKVIAKHKKEDLSYKTRAKSYKRDYRPAPYAGTSQNLAYLKYNPKEKQKAFYACFNDFGSRWMIVKSKIKAFSKAKIWLNSLILNNRNSKILYNMDTNIAFINKIGGIPHSFNYRKTWPKKVEYIMKKTKLVQLVDDMENNKMSFEEAWRK